MRSRYTQSAVLPPGARNGGGGIRSTSANPAPAKSCCAWKPAACATRTSLSPVWKSLPLAPAYAGPRRHRHRGSGRPGRDRLGARRPRRHHLPGHHLRNLRVVRCRAASASVPSKPTSATRCKARSAGLLPSLPPPRWCACPPIFRRLEAAPLCCAGWTAYGALREAALTPGQIRGPLRLRRARPPGAADRAPSRDCASAVSDLSEEKVEMALARARTWPRRPPRRTHPAKRVRRHGCRHRVHGSRPPPSRRLSAPLHRNGTLVLVGLSVSQYELPLVDTVLKGITVRGSYLGSRQDLADVFTWPHQGVLRPHVHTHAIDETPALLDSHAPRRASGTGRDRF